MNILGIESTCDETGVAIVANGRDVLIDNLASSVNLQKKFGGVVPELAAREQARVILPLISDVVREVAPKKIDAIAVSYGPGLIGPLLIGVETAKALSYVWKKPLIAINHLSGHFFANFIGRGKVINFPAIGLIVSGGHTDLLFYKNINSYTVLGRTRDDAAGEAFDKISKYLGLGYPGGPSIEHEASKFADVKLANGKNPFPIPMLSSQSYDFSFSGLKTAVVNHLEKHKDYDKKLACYYFQESIVDALVNKTIRAARFYGVKSIVVGGGVAANKRLREKFDSWSDEVKIFFPDLKYSVDNGAMVATAAYYQQNVVDTLSLTADSSLAL